MSDDRLFVSNNAIGRKWYFINLIILAGITFGFNWIFTNYIFENITGETYSFIAKFMEYFFYIILFLTLLSLIDRRLYDIAGDRRNSKYQSLSKLFTFCIFAQIITFISTHTQFQLPIPTDVLNHLAMAFAGLFAVMGIIIGFINGEISNLSYEKYRNKIKYQ